MKSVLFLLLSFFALILETTLFQSLPTLYIRFDIPFLLLVYLALYVDSTELGFTTVFIIGLMTDALAAPFFGSFTLIYTAVYLIFRIIKPHIFLESSAAVLTTVALLSSAKEILFFAQMSWRGIQLPLNSFIIFQLALQVLLNVLMAFVIFKLLSKIMSPTKAAIKVG